MTRARFSATLVGMARVQPNWFVALPVPAGPWLGVLSSPPPRVRLFAKADLHITVAFFGDVDEAAARRAFTAAEAWPTGPLSARLGEVRALGNPRRPSALSVIVGEGFDAIAGAVGVVRDDMFKLAGSRRDGRPPLPHVTLARIERRASNQERRAALEWAGQVDLGAPVIELDRIALYTWAPDRRQRLFEIADERTLAAD